MKKLISLLIVFVIVFPILTACNKTNVQQLSKDKGVNNVQQENSYIPLPSNKEENHRKRHNNPELISYANDYGQFLEQISRPFNEIDEFLDQNHFSDDELNRIKNHVKKMQQQVEKMNTIEAPKPFKGLQAIHDTVLVELQLLEQSLNHNQLMNEKNRRLARVYFDNIISFHRSMQTEYRTTTSELGIY